MKRTKYIVSVAVCVVAVTVTLIGVFIYKTRFEVISLDTSVSPDGVYRLTLSSVGEPDWSFGSAHGRIMLAKADRILCEAEIDLAQDGCQLCKENWSVVWQSDCAQVTLRASEQEDEYWQIYFDGRFEQSANANVEYTPDSAETLPESAQQSQTPTVLKMRSSVRENGEAVFLVPAEDFIERFNCIYGERNGRSYLKSLDTWAKLEGITPFHEYRATLYRFSADTQLWSMPTLSIFLPENGEGIYEMKLTFDDHGYQQSMYREFKEICFCALSAVLPALSEDEITALYSDLYAHLWGEYYPDSGRERPDIEAMYRNECVGLYGYYGAGTANICIVPFVETDAQFTDEQGTNFKSVK